MAKSFKLPTDFYNKTVSIVSGAYSVSTDMGLTSNPTVIIASLNVSLQHNDGTKSEFLGGMSSQSTHWANCPDNQPLIRNGHILVYGTDYYEITYCNFIESFFNSYFEMGLNLIREA